MTLAKTLKKKSVKDRQPRRKEPLWKGPEIDGITQSMLSRFLVCKERFRLLVVKGLRPVDTFNHRMEYGQMWHICEECWSAGDTLDWVKPLRVYCSSLCKKYPLQQEQIQHWYNVCEVQFPIYVGYWRKQKGPKSRSLMQEQVFDVPYELPSGRVVRLRGKWDSVSLEGKGKSTGIWLHENKAKGDVNEGQMKRQLMFDLQTMIYLIALREYSHQIDNEFKAGQQIKGVNYNVVRRPLSGGKYSIRQHKPTKAKPNGESADEFYGRLGDLITLDREWFFMRWQVIITAQDVERFKREFLNPVLESLCVWYEIVVEKSCTAVLHGAVHWRTPHGFYNVLAEGGSTELDEYLATGSELGLERTDKLFRELE